MRIDIHQHLWTEPLVEALVEALARRTEPPRHPLAKAQELRPLVTS